MIQIQVNIDLRLNDNNRIEINELHREDANDHEREIANSIYGVLRQMLLDVRDEVGPEQMTLEELKGHK